MRPLGGSGRGCQNIRLPALWVIHLSIWPPNVKPSQLGQSGLETISSGSNFDPVTALMAFGSEYNIVAPASQTRPYMSKIAPITNCQNTLLLYIHHEPPHTQICVCQVQSLLEWFFLGHQFFSLHLHTPGPSPEKLLSGQMDLGSNAAVP